MYYPGPTTQDVLRFEADGFLVVHGAIDPEESAALSAMGAEMTRRPDDWGMD